MESQSAPPAYSDVCIIQPSCQTTDNTNHTSVPPSYNSVNVSPNENINIVIFSRKSVATTCVHCGSNTKTTTRKINGPAVYGCMLVCLLFGCCCGCCLFPLCCPSYKDIDHFCSICHGKIGTAPASPLELV